MDVPRFFAGCISASSLLLAQPSNLPTSSLTITKHKAHSEEITSKNGIQKKVHIIIKNSPYHLTLTVVHGLPKVDFGKVAFEAFLLYDTESMKEVDYVKVKPMDFKYTPIDSGLQLEVELRFKVLSSQHEDMLFRVKIQGYNPTTLEPLPQLTLFTPSIKVISKPEQLKAKQATPSKKRTLPETLLATVARIEQKQEDQQLLLERLFKQQLDHHSRPSPKRQCIKMDNLWEVAPKEHAQEKEVKKGLDVAFLNLLRAFNAMSAEEKPETIRKVVRNTSSRDTEKLAEILDLLCTEGPQEACLPPTKSSTKKSVSGLLGNNGCVCVDCPHKQELERIDEFYKEFLSAGLSVPVSGF